MIKALIRLLKKFDLYRYVAADTREWYQWAHKASATERRQQKPLWLKAGRAEPRREKASWTRFSFPHGYNMDLLEILLLIGQEDKQKDKPIKEAIELLLSKRNQQGKWKMVGGLNGKMWADLDQKGKSSPWITFRALLALKRFNLFQLS